VSVELAWREAIDRRAKAAFAGDPGLPWEEVKANLQRRLSGG
jgi:hypothetical protein